MKKLRLWNDIKRNKTIHGTLFLFLVFAYTLAVVSVLVAAQLVTSLQGLYRVADPPHFLQMHKGDMNEEAIGRFAEDYPGCEYWQVVPMINIYGDSLTVKKETGNTGLGECRLDISMVKQNKDKDLLLDQNREKASVKSGEMGIPMLLKDAYGIELGDRIELKTEQGIQEFVVSKFVLDAQMNSSMCSSTRILISDEDFEAMYGKAGETEYLIETYFTDTEMAADFQTAYESAGLPANGQAVTYPIIFLLSAITDLGTAFLLLMASILMTCIAIMCIRFTVLATLEEDLQEIGTMKAIGIAYREIRGMYLEKYRFLAVLAGIAGYLAALGIGSIFTAHIRTMFGKSEFTLTVVALPVIACVLVYVLVMNDCRRTIRKIRKVTVVDALVTKEGFQGRRKKGKSGKSGLYKSKWMPSNLLLAVREVAQHPGNWSVLFLVALITTTIILIPVNLIHTMKSPEFVSCMGSSPEDIMITLENGKGLEDRYAKAVEVLQKTDGIGSYEETGRVRVMVPSAEEEKSIHVDCGQTAGQGLEYLSGKAPEGEDQIALSYLNAKDLGKRTGDRIQIAWGNHTGEFMISGIYQDVTSGGYTAKSCNTFEGTDKELYTFYVTMEEKAASETATLEKATELSGALSSGYDVAPMAEFLDQTLGGVTDQLQAMAALIVAMAFALTGLVVVLFLKLRLVKDYSQTATLKAMGFSVADIKKQYLYKTGIVSITGILIGVLFATAVGEKILGLALRMAGIGLAGVNFIVDPFTAYVLCPTGLALTVIVMTGICVKPVKSQNIVALINE